MIEMQVLCEYLHNRFPQDNSKLPGSLRQHRASKLSQQDGLILYNNRIIVPTGMYRHLFRIHKGYLQDGQMQGACMFCCVLARHQPRHREQRWLLSYVQHVLQSTSIQANDSPSMPFKAYQKVGADIFTIHGKVLVVAYFRKFPEYVELSSKSADCVIQHLKNIIAFQRC